MDFRWRPDESPPRIEPHSKAKLRVLREYLRAYFDRLNVNPNRDAFKLDLIDGFAGGGTFRDGNDLLSGTPLIMLEEASSASKRLNRGRIKRLHIDCKFYFVDKERAHTDHLRKVLHERGHKVDEERIEVRTGLFEDEIDGVLDSIRRRQPRAGRAIFLLDQTGFSQVALDLVSRIFRELRAAEVILTFAADALVNHLAETPKIVKAVAPLQLPESRIRELIEHRSGRGGRTLVQRVLRDHARRVTGTSYDTPFFIRPDRSRRALWFLHLSNHPTARDVMIQQHWNLQNTFQHYGPGDFGMMGWDSLKDSNALPLFQFGKLDERRMEKQLMNTLPEELFGMASERPVTIDALQRDLANRTAARFFDLHRIILRLYREGEFEILDPDGKPRSRASKQLRDTDRVALPSTLLFPGLSRRR